MKLLALKLYSKITKKSIYFVSKDNTYYIQPNGSVVIGVKSNDEIIRGNRAKYIDYISFDNLPSDEELDEVLSKFIVKK
jgi:hypothetical protein